MPRGGSADRDRPHDGGGRMCRARARHLTSATGRVPLRCRLLRHRRLEQREIPAVPLRLEAVDRNESECRRVHTVAQSRRRRPVVEHVAQMRVGVGGPDFGTYREERPIHPLTDIARLEGFGEAGPPRTRVELVERTEERLAGHDVHVDPCLMVVPVLVVKRGLGSLVLGHLVLLRRERATQVGVAWLVAGHRVPSFRATLGARALGNGAEGEREPQGAANAGHYFTVKRTVSTTSGFSGMCFQFATTAITRCGPGLRESSTNSVCPRPRWSIPVTPRGIVSSTGVRP